MRVIKIACMANENNMYSNQAFMTVKAKRRLTYGTILMFNLCTGLGYAIIFPTIWNYIHDRLGGESSMLGVVISAYSLSSFFANPFVGWWSDKSLNTRMILLVTILAEMIGSIMYFIGIYTWVLVVGRLIAGLGAGGGAAVLADITRTTVDEERTPVLSVVIASRQLGLIIGPAFNIFLSKADFSLFSLPVDKYTSPGLFMAFLWCILELTVFFAYYNLTELKDDEDVEKLFENYNSVITGTIPYDDLDTSTSLEVALATSYPPYSSSTPTAEAVIPGTLTYSSSQPNVQVEWLQDNAENFSAIKKEEIETINCQKINVDPSNMLEIRSKRLRNAVERTRSISDRMIESAERLIQSTSESYADYVQEDSDIQNRPDSSNLRASSTNPSTPSRGPPSLSDEKSSLLGHIREDYFRDEIIVLLGLAFISCFAQTVLETIVTPLAQKYYNFTELDNSYIYLVAGIEVILVFSLIKYISRKVSDRALIIFGLMTLSTAMILLIIFVPHAVPGEMKTLPFFICTIVIDLIGIAVIVVCSSSLLSKLINEDSQALFQGFRRSMCSLGCIMGPLWGGAFLFDMYFLFAVPLSVTILIMVLFLFSYRKLQIDRIEL